ncbi:MAG: polysaccharide deacetylase family protein [Clostridia bacterium]|nr:polysaccharide deacetylase family protein [Clostridia bacterium]
MNRNFTKDQIETMKLVTVLSVLVLIMLVLALTLMNNLEYPAANTDPQTQYMELPALENMPLESAKQTLDSLDISYEVIPTQSCVANRVERVEYTGKDEDGKRLYEIGTTVKLHANEVGADKVIYLTFDDGPMVRYDLDMTVYYTTDELLSVLDEYGVKATFFLAGYQMVKSDRSHFVNELFDRGHLIACHSYSHDLARYTIRPTISSPT